MSANNDIPNSNSVEDFIPGHLFIAGRLLNFTKFPPRRLLRPGHLLGRQEYTQKSVYMKEFEISIY